MKHLLKLGGMTSEEILHILDVADEYKRLHKDGVDPKDLQGKAVALVFAKNSTRCPPTAARRSPPMCWKPTPTKFSTRRRTASTWKRPCWRCCWRGNKSIAVRRTAGERERANLPFFWGGNGETGGNGKATGRACPAPTDCGKVGCRAACPQAAVPVCGNEKPCQIIVGGGVPDAPRE